MWERVLLYLLHRFLIYNGKVEFGYIPDGHQGVGAATTANE